MLGIFSSESAMSNLNAQEISVHKPAGPWIKTIVAQLGQVKVWGTGRKGQIKLLNHLASRGIDHENFVKDKAISIYTIAVIGVSPS